MSEIKEIPEDYYLHNFLEILSCVKNRYNDLLNKDDLSFINTFYKLSEDCQKLYIRLISRKGPWFIKKKLVYPEIQSIEKAIIEGIKYDFFHFLTEENLEIFLETLTITELHIIAKSLKLKIKFRKKQDVLEKIIQYESSKKLFLTSHEIYPAITPDGQEKIRLFLLLYFGNCRQDLTEFVLQDLGLFVFEKYEIQPKHRLFQNRKEIEQHLLVDLLNDYSYDLIESQDEDEITILVKLLEQTLWQDSSNRKVSRIYNRIGAYFERTGELKRAIKLFENSTLHPAIERRARILDQLGETYKALSLVKKTAIESTDEEEREFAQKFISKCSKKLGYPILRLPKTKITTKNTVLEKIINQNIEITVINSLENKIGVHCENMLWRSLFGLTFWDVIFMPVAGAFQNPFQRGPLDLFSQSFLVKRKQEIEQCLDSICKNTNFSNYLLEKFDQKKGITNYFVSWDEGVRGLLAVALDRIAPKILANLFEKMLSNLRRYGTGFPDLFIYSLDTLEFELWEVKGPSDTLRPIQRMWLNFFQEQKVKAFVIKVKWKK